MSDRKVISLDEFKAKRRPALVIDEEKERLVRELDEMVRYIDTHIMPLDRTGPIE